WHDPPAARRCAIRFPVTFLVCLLALALAPQTRLHAAPSGDEDARAEQWRADLRFLATELPSRHKNAFFRITRGAFERAVAELDGKLPSLSESEAICGLLRVVALVGDTHTQLSGWQSRFRRYPVDLWGFSDGFYVISAAPEYRRAVGARLIR